MTATTMFLCKSFIIFLGQIPRSSISGSKGMNVFKALDFYCLQKAWSIWYQRRLSPSFTTPSFEVGIAWGLFQPDHSLLPLWLS